MMTISLGNGMQLTVDSGQLPMGWIKTKLRDVCQKVEYGSSAKSKPEGKIPVLRMGNIQNGVIDWNDLVYTIDQEEIDKYLLKYNDILFNRTNSAEHVGKTAIYKGERPAIFAGYLIRIHRKEDLIDADFLNYYLNSNTVREYGKSVMSRSVNQANINGTKLKEYPIILPPLPEQKRIVAILDEAFEGIDRAIANTEKNLANSRELFESYLNTIFTQKGDGWEEKKLGDICSIKHGFAFKGEFFTAEKSNYILLTPGSFYENGGYRDQGEKTKYYIGEIPDGFILKKGDFLFAMTEQAVGLLGSSLIVPDSDKFLHNQRLGLVQVVDGFEWHNDFFFHQFNTYFREQCFRLGNCH
ncbi:MAG: restriction endonuclease subunit S [Calothrix sp. MO_167.B42]|nr:restriction endonuclease subunit S [Calothrix sp. MO_167.B42]